MENTLNWNVLTDKWLGVINSAGDPILASPFDVLGQSHSLRSIWANSPMDVFAGHRFLLTLLYWKAECVGGVEKLRERLLAGEIPKDVLNALCQEQDRFWLYGEKQPFLQDPTLDRKRKKKSIGVLFQECASGTNVSHFHHSDDLQMRLCFSCLTEGLVRVVPWMPPGGAGISPALHGTPPIRILARGKNLIESLGLNLVTFPQCIPKGDSTWSGHFRPTDTSQYIPYMEAFTWNPRRICLDSPERGHFCWRCGRVEEGLPVVGPIIFEKNPDTVKGGHIFRWKDPACFYPIQEELECIPDDESQYMTAKSIIENSAFREEDIDKLAIPNAAFQSEVHQQCPQCKQWILIVPCAKTGIQDKTFDHRYYVLNELSCNTLKAARTPMRSPAAREAPAGWHIPDRASRVSWAFLRAIERYTDGDWAVFAQAADRAMNESPEAFDLFSGLYWRLRNKSRSLPDRGVLWLTLKLMAAVPASFRKVDSTDGWNPLEDFPKCQKAPKNTQKHSAKSLRNYPCRLPIGGRLESELRRMLHEHVKRRHAEPINWVKLCDQLDELMK